MILIFTIVLVLIVSEDVIGLPCVSNEAKEDFDKSRKDLIVGQSDIGDVVNKLESNYQKTIKILESTLKNNLGTFKSTLNSMGKKLKKLDTDFTVLGKDFRKTKWIKYDGHCYYYSSEATDWFTAERTCREIGGYLVKLDNDGEMKNIYSNVNKKKEEISIKKSIGISIFNSFATNKREVAILFIKNFECKIHRKKKDNRGNLLGIDIEIEGKRITFIRLYCPNKDSPDFFSRND